MLVAMAEQAQRIRQRRRGEELEAALLEAAWAELVEVGFARLTMVAKLTRVLLALLSSAIMSPRRLPVSGVSTGCAVP